MLVVVIIWAPSLRHSRVSQARRPSSHHNHIHRTVHTTYNESARRLPLAGQQVSGPDAIRRFFSKIVPRK
ncbi:hypothetical protein BDV06DRAFT_177433 [Aspergillus oleicola]